MERSLQIVDECLDRMKAKYEALKELVEIMAKHKLGFVAKSNYDEYGNVKTELSVVQDYFEDGDPITLFSVNEGVKSEIDYVKISRN